MSKEVCLAIVKPDAFEHALEIRSMFEVEDITAVRVDELTMSREQAEAFYAVHKGNDYFEGMIAYLTEGPISLMVLQGENVIKRSRATLFGTVRPRFATANTQPNRNAAHVSDSPESARREILIFYPDFFT